MRLSSLLRVLFFLGDSLLGVRAGDLELERLRLEDKGRGRCALGDLDFDLPCDLSLRDMLAVVTGYLGLKGLQLPGTKPKEVRNSFRRKHCVFVLYFLLRNLTEWS